MRILGALGIFAAAALSACGGADAPTPVAAGDAAEESPAADTEAIDSGLEAGSDTGASDAAPAAAPALLSLNLHCLKTEGTTFTTNTARFAAIADRVAAEGVVAIAVQEACVRGGESAMELLATELERATGVTWSSHWAFAHRAWEGTADEADEGVGIFVRGALTAPGVITHRVQSALVRVTVGATLPSGLRLHSVHFDYVSAAARAAQARELAVAALVDTDPGFGAIVAGDFNARAGDEAHAALRSFGFRDLSASLDAGRIDHVLAHRASGITAGSARLIFDGKDGPQVSDHPGVLVTLVEGAKETPTITRVTGRAKLVTGQWLALRGAIAPLTWTAGFAARETSEGFRVVLTEMTGPKAEVKLLRDDTTWMIGDNATITPGADQIIDASF